MRRGRHNWRRTYQEGDSKHSAKLFRAGPVPQGPSESCRNVLRLATLAMEDTLPLRGSSREDYGRNSCDY